MKISCLKKAGFTKIIDNCVIFKVGTDIDVLQSAFRLSKLMKIIHLICNNFLNAMLNQNWDLKDARAGADRGEEFSTQRMGFNPLNLI